MILNDQISQGTHLPYSNIPAYQRNTSVFKHSDDEQISVIRKEFVLLTGDPFSAVVLNQLMYWTQRVKDFDLLLKEERTFKSDCNVPPRYGWIYKTAHDLIEETMLGISHPTMRKYLKLLIDRGWIDERAHPIDKWNKTTQYRVNLRKLQKDLIEIGRNLPLVYLKAFSCFLQEEALPQPAENSDLQSNVRNLHSNESLEDSLLPFPLESKEIPNVKILHSNVENFHSDVKNLHSNVRNLHSYTYTKNTPKTTNREHAEGTREEKDFFDEVLEIWNTCVSHEGLPSAHLTDERRRQIYSLFPLYFESDLTQWKQFCYRVASSPFLMGQGPRKWRVSLDWILVEENLIKVLEGNFDDPKGLEQKQTIQNNAEKTKEISTIFTSIKDPMWRGWCSQLDFSLESRDPITLGELKSIANAKFLEVEGDRLVWIGSSDPQVLSRIEDLRLKLLPLTQRTFPKVRNLRTRLCEEHSVLQKESTQQVGEHS